MKHNIGWWIYCDLDGKGDKWRLAIPRVMLGKAVRHADAPEDDMLYFPVEDFEDLADNYADDPRRVVRRPTDLPKDGDTE